MIDIDAEIRAFVVERDKMLLSLDIERMKMFHAEHNPLGPPFSDEQALVAIHKTRTGASSLPICARRHSYEWLRLRGYSSWDDGDLA